MMQETLPQYLILLSSVLILAYLSVNEVSFTYEEDVTIDKGVGEVFHFLRDPKNLVLYQGSVTNVSIQAENSNLDEKDGHLKEEYSADILQNFLLWRNAKYSMKRSASSAQNVIVTSGQVLGISYTTDHVLSEDSKSKTLVKETTKTTGARLTSWLLYAQIKNGVIDRLLKLKQVMES